MQLMVETITPVTRTDKTAELIKSLAIGEGFKNLTSAQVQTLRLKAKKVGVTLKAETTSKEVQNGKTVAMFQVSRVPDAPPRTRTRKPKTD